MKLFALFAVVAAASSQFSCPKPVNPIPAGPPGLCCQELVEYPLLSFLYTGNTCTRAIKVDEAADGTTTYSPCETGQNAACCDPISEISD
ncbi:uncharacterized protein N7529_011094 [Penicillium soppii]|uniref:uncharacterized protein n=1 Tax=Penicillium soppii TaxID=69789 RepID=UPI0025480AA7|nr:uncharacterized protein N7529_011094 [Penicillium soppii]KAJ5851709.1 hypothetical protein N7529_011094 [Penicillium soppii]